MSDITVHKIPRQPTKLATVAHLGPTEARPLLVPGGPEQQTVSVRTAAGYRTDVPATFPSHAAAPLPLKLWRPRWFDGVALVVGSAAPDAYYALNGFIVWPSTHHLPGAVWFALPVALIATVLVRWAAPVVAAHLPDQPTWLALPDYAVLGRVRHRWYVTVSSALIGALSHITWDGFTHSPMAQHGWGVRLIPALETQLRPGLPVWLFAQHASTVVGALVVAGVAVMIGRRRLLRAWHGAPPALPARPWLFWPPAVAVGLAYVVTWPLLPYQYATYVQGVRMIEAAMLAMLAGTLVVRLAGRWERTGPPEAAEPAR
jgi:hypothetical protein